MHINIKIEDVLKKAATDLEAALERLGHREPGISIKYEVKIYRPSERICIEDATLDALQKYYSGWFREDPSDTCIVLNSDVYAVYAFIVERGIACGPVQTP